MKSVPQEKRFITKGRFNKMCKYFRNKRVCISYEYNNSLGDNVTTYYTGKYDEFGIVLHKNVYGFQGSEVNFILKGENVFTYFIESVDSSEFVDVGAIRSLNDGPYCYFRIERTW